MNDTPLYNSRIIKTYLEHTEKHYPEIDVDSVLRYAGMTTYELEDKGHWFTQRQVDRFYEILVEKAGDPNIAREAGRYAATSQASGALRQYALGFLTPATAYRMLEKLASNLSRAHTFRTRQIGRDKVEVTVSLKPGVMEKSYQCDNRIGLLESIAKLFTGRFARVEHPSCLYRGDDVGRYIISWERNPSSTLKRIRSYLAVCCMIVIVTLYFVIPFSALFTFFLACCILVLGISFSSERMENRQLVKSIENQGNAANELLVEINTRYNNALLIKEVGEATCMLSDVDNLLKSIMEGMKSLLDFDRGGIWLANNEKSRLVYKVGYGYDSKMEAFLENAAFHLDNPRSKGVLVLAFKKQRPYMVDNLSDIVQDLSERSLKFARQLGAHSFICVPIVYEGESLGLLLVDNVQTKRSLSQSDMSLLMGIAPQIAMSIHNALSYSKIQASKEREKNLRKLFEKYVPAPIIKRYVNSGETDLFCGEELPVSVFFLDIRNFTSCSEDRAPIEIVSLLNEYYEQCANLVIEENGHINKYTGDGFLAIFGAPEPLENHSLSAFNAACRILRITNRFTLGARPMEVGIGLSSGSAILGNIGSASKIEYTAIGDTINMAARLQEMTKSFLDYHIIMCKDSWMALRGHPFSGEIKCLGTQEIRGKKEPVEVFGFLHEGEYDGPTHQGEAGFFPLQEIKGV